MAALRLTARIRVYSVPGMPGGCTRSGFPAMRELPFLNAVTLAGEISP